MPIILPSSLHELALFAGAGGGILGGKLLGWKCVCAVEYEPAARRMLAARQDDGCLEPFPIWDDVRTFDGKPWRGLVDVVSGGFPCQDISAAGKGAGLDGERSGLWSEMSRIIGEVRPRFALVENSPVLTSRGLGVVLGDLAAMGYDARWGVLGAIDAGAPHKRERIWIVGHAMCHGLQTDNGRESVSNPHWHSAPHEAGREEFQQRTGGASHLADHHGLRQLQPQGSKQAQRGWAGDSGQTMADSNRSGCQEQRRTGANGAEHETAERGSWWSAEPDVGRVAHGVASRVDRLRALGNGQVPAVVRLAWDLLKPKK